MRPTSKGHMKRSRTANPGPAPGDAASPAWDRDEPYKELLRAVFAPPLQRGRKDSANAAPGKSRTRDT